MSALRIALALLLTFVACASPPSGGAQAGSSLLFSYDATDGEFTLSERLNTDGTWTRSEHSGTAAPSGRLSRSQLRTFRALLALAPFRTESVHCDHDPTARATVQAGDGRTATATSARDAAGLWGPCGQAFDPVTDRLSTCLSALMRGDESSPPSCALPGG